MTRVKRRKVRETVEQYMRERADFLRVYAVEVPSGGVDVCLRVDGTCFGELACDIQGQVDYERDRLVSALSESGIDTYQADTLSPAWFARQIRLNRAETMRYGEQVAWTAGELVEIGMCSGACIVATGKPDGCDCRCDGVYHGALNMIVVPSPAGINGESTD